MSRRPNACGGGSCSTIQYAWQESMANTKPERCTCGSRIIAPASPCYRLSTVSRRLVVGSSIPASHRITTSLHCNESTSFSHGPWDSTSCIASLEICRAEKLPVGISERSLREIQAALERPTISYEENRKLGRQDSNLQLPD